MEEVKSNAGMWGMGGWNVFNTLLAASGLATGATALGTKVSKSDVRGCHGGYGYYGEGCSPCSDNTPVNRFELNQSQRISELESDRRTDAKILDVYKQSAAENAAILEKMRDNFETAYKTLAEHDKQIALNKQANDYQFIMANREFDAINGRVSCLTSRVNAITKEVVPLGAICPQPLPGCVPVALEPQTIQTEAAGAQGVIIANKAAAASAGK